MALRIQIAKFKFRQYLPRANSPNLMLTKLSYYTVIYALIEHKVQIQCIHLLSKNGIRA